MILILVFQSGDEKHAPWKVTQWLRNVRIISQEDDVCQKLTWVSILVNVLAGFVTEYLNVSGTATGGFYSFDD